MTDDAKSLHRSSLLSLLMCSSFEMRCGLLLVGHSSNVDNPSHVVKFPWGLSPPAGAPMTRTAITVTGLERRNVNACPGLSCLLSVL